MRNTFVFATLVCLVCSVSLATFATWLKPRQQYNLEIDQKKNILMALGLVESGAKVEAKAVEKLYEDKVKAYVIDKSGSVQPDMKPNQIPESSELLPVFERQDNNYVALPVAGMGLWSLLKGYIALKEDGHTVAGITFYEQAETPGLGAEISTEWFTQNFVGKDILNPKGELVSIQVAKGKAADAAGVDISNVVDGISGATMTCRGVTNLLKVGMQDYRPFLENKWQN